MKSLKYFANHHANLSVKRSSNKWNLVYIHGFNDTWYTCKEFLAKLFDACSSNIYVCDLPNHGKNFDFDVQLSFHQYCEFVIRQIRKWRLQKNIVLVGHSMGGGIVSAISYKIPGIKKTLLLDPLQDAVSSHLWKRTYEMFISGEMTKNYQEFIVKKNNPTCHTFKLISSLVFDKNISLEIEKGLKKNIHPIYVFFGSKDDIIPPIDSINYLKKVIKPRFFHSILIKNAKHAPHETHIDFVVDEFVKILK